MSVGMILRWSECPVRQLALGGKVPTFLGKVGRKALLREVDQPLSGQSHQERGCAVKSDVLNGYWHGLKFSLQRLIHPTPGRGRAPTSGLMVE